MMPTTSHDGADRSAEEERWRSRSRLPAVALAVVAGVLGVLVMAEWLAGTDVLIRLGRSETETTFNTAVMAVLVAAGILVSAPWVQRACFAAAGLLALAVLAQHLTGTDLGIDELVVSHGEAAAGVEPGRPSAVTATAFALFAAAGLLMTWRQRLLAQVAASAALVMAVASVFAHVYRVRPALDSDAPELMPFVATFLVAVLGLALMFTIPGSLVQWIAFGRDTGARIQRTVAPLVLVVLPLLGGGLVVGMEQGWFDVRGAAALLVTFAVTFSVLVAAWVGLGSRRMDEERDALLLEVRRVNQELEDRVRMRSHEVNRQRTKLALLEERDRIARDLHDRVIQRIFAAGLQIGALSRSVAKLADGGDASRLPGQLDSIAGELDLAIRELRNSIFQLTSIDDHQDLDQVVHDIAARSSRILGFMPQVTVSGDVSGVRSDLAADLASTIQEGLSNVARHARASAAAVSLEGTERELVVRIADDGVGLPDPLPRSSGISNLINRARGLGGTASWEPASPTGTIFTWRVARDGQVDEFYGNDLGPAQTPPRPASGM
jgi:signal transduction histidine kinase